MGLLDNFKNPFEDALQRVSESQNELFKDVGKVIDTSHITKNSFLEQLYGKNQSTIKDPNTTLVNSRKDIVVVIDPGHGIDYKPEGASATKGYEHYLKDENGNLILENGSPKKVISDFNQLPDYVIEEIKKVKFNGTCNATNAKWVIRRIEFKPENNDIESKIERVLVWKVAKQFEKLLVLAGYKVVNTRNILADSPDIATRNKIAKNADYFIYLHADGACNAFVSGALSEYQKYTNIVETNINKEFARDILSFYNVILINPNSPFEDFQRSGKLLGVLKPDNTAKRKTLIELGYATNPSDYEKIENNLKLVAAQLLRGLEKNVVKYYKQKAFEVAGKVFYNQEEAIEEDFRIQKDIRNRSKSIVSLQEFSPQISTVVEIEAPIEPLQESIYTDFVLSS